MMGTPVGEAGAGPMPKIVDRDAKRAELVHAALSVFADRGYHRTTMQQVAERAGVSKGAVYEYFDSKEELFVSAADTLMHAMFEPALQTLEGGDGDIRKRLGEFVVQVLAGVEAWSVLCTSVAQVWAELGARDESPLRVLMREQYLTSARRIATTFDLAVEHGEAARFATFPAAMALLAVLDGVLLQAMILGASALREVAGEAFRSWCITLVPPPRALRRSGSC
jgi:AcrR family transcriptional regulator